MRGKKPAPSAWREQRGIEERPSRPEGVGTHMDKWEAELKALPATPTAAKTPQTKTPQKK